MKLLTKMVGTAGFEPTTPTPPVSSEKQRKQLNLLSIRSISRYAKSIKIDLITLFKSMAYVTISILITSCAGSSIQEFAPGERISISIDFAEGDLPLEAIAAANEILSRSLPYTLQAGSQGSIQCHATRLDWLDMLDYNPWLSLRAVAVIDPETCEIYIRKGEQDPQHLGNVLAHELGHRLGLDHSKEKGSIMNEELKRGARYQFTDRDTEQSARRLLLLKAGIADL